MTGAVGVVSAQVFQGIGDLGVEFGIGEGDVRKVLVHAAAGCGIGAVTSGSCLAGAVGAGLQELASPVLDGLSDKTWMRVQLAGLAGASASEVEAAARIASLARANNRELHPDEAVALRELEEGKGPEEIHRLRAAACALTGCANQGAETEADYAKGQALQQEGAGYKAEQASLIAAGFRPYTASERHTDQLLRQGGPGTYKALAVGAAMDTLQEQTERLQFARDHAAPFVEHPDEDIDLRIPVRQLEQAGRAPVPDLGLTASALDRIQGTGPGGRRQEVIDDLAAKGTDLAIEMAASTAIRGAGRAIGKATTAARAVGKADGVVVPGTAPAKSTPVVEMPECCSAPKSRVVASYGPLKKGLLSDDIAKTFRSGTYHEVIATKPTTLYRVIGDSGNPAGEYWTRTKPGGPLQSIIDSALDQNWGNTATRVVEIEIPAGTRLFEGVAAPQRGLVGGGSQVYFDKILNPVNPDWIR